MKKLDRPSINFGEKYEDIKLTLNHMHIMCSHPGAAGGWVAALGAKGECCRDDRY
ncbi:MAG TPA: hypothetical protein VF557_05575 [Jatrophihabitans sp.]|jgi:hypothetical protein|uniref:hypothetical protein n=1 Tax=Jatrophihabitans sp. TaxID=1932789 RepID=UPI002EE2F015